jgi:hypothetical protein
MQFMPKKGRQKPVVHGTCTDLCLGNWDYVTVNAVIYFFSICLFFSGEQLHVHKMKGPCIEVKTRWGGVNPNIVCVFIIILKTIAALNWNFFLSSPTSRTNS